MNIVLEKYRNLRPINNEDAYMKLMELLVEVPEERQEDMWIRDNNSGHVCLFQHELFPGIVVEYVQGSRDDSVTSLYEGNPLFSSRAALQAARNEIIGEIARILMALPKTVVVHDAGRERDAHLFELGTAQLLDVLAHFTHTDMKTV